jgi:lipopolysaccharide assembly outer membrane protein LptD (OstA)
MRSISLLGLLCLCSMSLVSQQKLSEAEQVDLNLWAEQMSTDEKIITLKGHVRAHMSRVTIYADEAEFDRSTMELTPRGHVRIKMLALTSGKPVADTIFRKLVPCSSEDTSNNPTDTPLRMPIPK